jgi:hypothetical protein
MYCIAIIFAIESSKNEWNFIPLLIDYVCCVYILLLFNLSVDDPAQKHVS